MNATNDYQQFTKLSDARVAVRAVRDRPKGKNTKLQKRKLTTSKTEAMNSFKASDNEQDARRQLQNVNQ